MKKNSAELPPHLKDLNPPQLEAVRHFKGPILILAGAGSGKTRVLTRRVVNLILEHQVRPDSIWAVTFTNKATNEMRERLYAMLGAQARNLWVSTFHSSGLKICRQYAYLLGYEKDFVVYDEQDSKEVLKQILKANKIELKKANEFKRAIGNAKTRYLFPKDLETGHRSFDDIAAADIYAKYQAQLFSTNAMDFGDLLMNAVRLLKEFPAVREHYRRSSEFILVDEFQDTNFIQYEMVKLIGGGHRNILVVGDDDQSIYGFRGANIQNILCFEDNFKDAKVVKLEQNYRSTSNILEAAHSIIEKNEERKAKKLWTDQEGGALINTFIAEDEDAEAEFIADTIQNKLEYLKPSEIAVFYRTNAQSRALEEAMIRAKLPYMIYGGMKFYDRKEIKDVLAYMRLIANERDNQALLRVINTPARGIGAKTIKSIIELATSESESLYATCLKYKEQNKKVAHFVDLIEGLKEIALSKGLDELIWKIVVGSGYERVLKEAKDPTSSSRLENLKELRAIGKGMNGVSDDRAANLASFLDRATLTDSTDQNEESGQSQKERISLMTIHLAKGLEFKCVFVTGFEEGLMPHYLSMFSQEEIQEERRLCYVAITRAMQELYVSRANYRGMFASIGGSTYRQASRFALDLPEQVLNNLSGTFAYEGFFDYEDDMSSEVW